MKIWELVKQLENTDECSFDAAVLFLESHGLSIEVYDDIQVPVFHDNSRFVSLYDEKGELVYFLQFTGSRTQPGTYLFFLGVPYKTAASNIKCNQPLFRKLLKR